MDWDYITNWKLLPGSHDFPGPDGGTCINEAAIVAAGLPYMKVSDYRDLPPCFSPVLGVFLMMINDSCLDAQRSQLMPFVMKLAGTMHGAAKEVERVRHLINKLFDYHLYFEREEFGRLLLLAERDIMQRGDYYNLIDTVGRLGRLCNGRAHFDFLLKVTEELLAIAPPKEEIAPEVCTTRLSTAKKKVPEPVA